MKNKFLKNILLILVIIGVAFIPTVVFAESAKLNFCQQEGVLTAFRIGGIALYIAKILIPILIIIFGTIDLSKAILAGNSETIGKQVVLLVKRVIAGVVVFFIPTILSAAFSLVDGYSKVENGFGKCMNCLLDTDKC